MSVDMFLKLDGINGESMDAKHKQAIQLHSFSFGISQVGSGSFGGGSGSGKAEWADIHFTKNVDTSTPTLIEHCATGKHIAKAQLFVRKSGAAGGQGDYYTITMTEVIVSGVQNSGSSAADLPQESLSLNYAKIQFEYKTQDDKGVLGKPVTAGWDLKVQQKV